MLLEMRLEDHSEPGAISENTVLLRLIICGVAKSRAHIFAGPMG